MTFKKAIALIVIVLVFNLIGNIFGLYEIWEWYDMPMHFFGGLAIGAFALAIWKEGIDEVRFKGRLAKHLKWWLVPMFVIGFVALVATVWEFHEFILDYALNQEFTRQPSIGDTMVDFFLGLLGAVFATAIFHRKK